MSKNKGEISRNLQLSGRWKKHKEGKRIRTNGGEMTPQQYSQIMCLDEWQEAICNQNYSHSPLK